MDLLEEFHPTDKIRIATGLQCVGLILNHQSRYADAIIYLEKCCKIREASLSPDHSSVISSLQCLGEIQRTQH